MVLIRGSYLVVTHGLIQFGNNFTGLTAYRNNTGLKLYGNDCDCNQHAMILNNFLMTLNDS